MKFQLRTKHLICKQAIHLEGIWHKSLVFPTNLQRATCWTMVIRSLDFTNLYKTKVCGLDSLVEREKLYWAVEEMLVLIQRTLMYTVDLWSHKLSLNSLSYRICNCEKKVKKDLASKCKVCLSLVAPIKTQIEYQIN